MSLAPVPIHVGQIMIQSIRLSNRMGQGKRKYITKISPKKGVGHLRIFWLTVIMTIALW